MKFESLERRKAQILGWHINLARGLQEIVAQFDRFRDTRTAFLYESMVRNKATYVAVFGDTATVEECLFGPGWAKLEEKQQRCLLSTLANCIAEMLLTMSHLDQLPDLIQAAQQYLKEKPTELHDKDEPCINSMGVYALAYLQHLRQ